MKLVAVALSTRRVLWVVHTRGEGGSWLRHQSCLLLKMISRNPLLEKQNNVSLKLGGP
jgi:hypothetical protein